MATALGQRPSQHTRSPHPSNLREIGVPLIAPRLIVQGSVGALSGYARNQRVSPSCPSDRNGRRARTARRDLGVIRRAVAQHRIEQDRHRGLDEQPAHPCIASLGDPAAALALPRAQLPGDEAEIRLQLMRPVKALRVIDRGHEGRRGHRSHARDRPHALHLRVAAARPAPRQTAAPRCGSGIRSPGRPR